MLQIIAMSEALPIRGPRLCIDEGALQPRLPKIWSKFQSLHPKMCSTLIWFCTDL
ncbi:hypothetical protein RB213_004846 [Colletotrichum asianum]